MNVESLGVDSRSDHHVKEGTGQESEAGKQAVTDENTAVLLSDFYRAGDGNDESFTAQLIVSQDDLAPEIEGVQNVWIQGVGCGSAIVHFSR